MPAWFVRASKRGKINGPGRQVILWANGSPSLRKVDELAASGELADTEIIIVHWENERQNAEVLRKYLDATLMRARR
jgi:hypothetical protein